MNPSDVQAIVLTRLIYASRAQPALGLSEMEAILKQAISNNSKAGISGMLCFNRMYFLQVIEGSRSEINALLNKLLVDNRHFDLQIIEYVETNERLWPSWSMNYATPTSKNNSIYFKYSSTEQFNPYLLNAQQALNLCLALTEQNQPASVSEAQVKSN